MTKQRVLLIAPECPWPADIGLKTHLIQVIEAWAPVCDLTVFGFYFTAAEADRWGELARRAGFQLGGLAPVRQGAALRWAQAAALAGARPLAEARYRDPEAIAAVQRLVSAAEDRGLAFDWVVHEVFHTLVPLTFRAPTRRLLFPVDSYSLYYTRMRRLASTPLEWLRSAYLSAISGRLERGYRGIDRVVTVAEPDAAVLRRHLPGAPVDVVPVAASLPGGRRVSRGHRLRVLVSGFYGIPTVARDTRLFLESWRAHGQGQADLVVWGRGAQRAGLAGPAARAGAEIVEWVEDYGAFLASGDVYVYPQRFSCGVQTKVQQAMAAGLAVMAVPDVLNPLRAQHNAQAWSVNEPAEAALELSILLGDRPRLERLGAAAASLMEREFAPSRIHRRLRQLIGAPEPVRAVPPEKGRAHEVVLHR